MPEKLTTKGGIARGLPNEKGWVNLVEVAGEPFLGEAPSAEAVPILTLIHLSDTHICDAQSPARVEMMDRYADPHNPTSAFIPFVGAYRANEIMTTQTLETVIRTVNSITTGILSSRPIDCVVVTGDVTDNAQRNELDWYLTLMDGGEIHPDSGDPTRWEGVAQSDPDAYDRSYWHPEGTPEGCKDDYPRSLYGLPTVPGLLDAVRKPFMASGLVHRWLATHGNHDAMLQGTIPANEKLEAIATGDSRMTSLAPDVDLEQTFGSWNMVGPINYVIPAGGSYTKQQADPRRTFNGPSDWATLHLSCGNSQHRGHGLTQKNADDGTKFWSTMVGEIKLISLDTVNIHGGWMGSLDLSQFEWLKAELADPAPKYFVLLSHHPLHDLFNVYAPEGRDRRVGIEEITAELLQHSRIIAWIAGHDHDNRITYVGEQGTNGFWSIITSSIIDWPQQGRLIEILEDNGKVVIATSTLNHESPIDLVTATSDLDNPVNLAGLSRILSANHWQRRQSNDFWVERPSGTLDDRNRYLWL